MDSCCASTLVGNSEDSVFGTGMQDIIASSRVGNTLLVAGRGSVLDFKGTAIVNAANQGCLGGGGVDGAITFKGGKVLAEARESLPTLDKKRTRCYTGDAVTTIGGDLGVEWCIHAVGPNYRMLRSMDEGDALLTAAYAACMREASSKKMPSVAFSLLSAGVFRGPQSLKNVIKIAVDTIASNLFPELECVVFCGYTPDECTELANAFSDISVASVQQIEKESSV